jgi:hypothetical protein
MPQFIEPERVTAFIRRIAERAFAGSTGGRFTDFRGRRKYTTRRYSFTAPVIDET